MSAWLRLLPAWVWALLVGLALTFSAGWWVNGARWEAKMAIAQEGHSEQLRLLADQAKEAEARQRRIERERQAAIEEVQKNAEQQLEVVRADADRAGDALERLQQRYAAAVASSRACGNSLISQLSETAEISARVSADMLGRIGEAARLYAVEADLRGVAGQACEKAYAAARDGGGI